MRIQLLSFQAKQNLEFFYLHGHIVNKKNNKTLQLKWSLEIHPHISLRTGVAIATDAEICLNALRIETKSKSRPTIQLKPSPNLHGLQKGWDSN